MPAPTVHLDPTTRSTRAAIVVDTSVCSLMATLMPGFSLGRLLPRQSLREVRIAFGRASVRETATTVGPPEAARNDGTSTALPL